MAKGTQLYLKCENCDGFFEHNGHKKKRWCSGKCKVAAWRKASQVQ